MSKKMRKEVLFVLVSILVLGFALPTYALDTTDPSLRLWLDASNTSTRSGTDYAGNLVQYVDTWADLSSYGSLISHQTIGESATDIDNHTPVLVQSSNKGNVFPAVNFRQCGDIVAKNCTDPFGNPFHLSDRLYQQSNLTPGSDPLDIGAGTDLTMYVTMVNFCANRQDFGPYQTMIGKTGPEGSEYRLGNNIKGDPAYGEHFFFMPYAESGIPGVPDQQWGLVKMEIDGDTLTITEWYDPDTRWGVSSGPIDVSGRMPDASFSALDPELNAGFALAFHCQGAGGDALNPWGNGAYERFAGQMGDVIMYARDLDATEEADIESYLIGKYNLPEPATLSLLGLGGLALIRRRRA